MEESVVKSWYRITEHWIGWSDEATIHYALLTEHEAAEYVRIKEMLNQDANGVPLLKAVVEKTERPPLEYIKEQIMSIEPEIHVKSMLLNQWKEHLEACYPGVN